MHGEIPTNVDSSPDFLEGSKASDGSIPFEQMVGMPLVLILFGIWKRLQILMLNYFIKC
jgi:hypothetical protein